MSAANQIINRLIEIGPIIIIPLMFLIIGFVTTRNQLKNFLNSLYIFLGLFGIAIMFSLFMNFFNPLIETIVASSQKETVVLDAGWLVSKNVILNSPITIQIIIAVLVINIIMLFLKMTRTINIDLWNWWILLVSGSIIFQITEIRWLGVMVAVVIYSITLVLNDIYAPYIENYYGIKGISNPQTQLVIWAPVTYLVNIIFNKIPFTKKAHVFFDEIQYRLAILFEPIVMGFLFGFIAGLFTKYNEISFRTGPSLIFALGMGLQLAIILVLLPRFVTLLFKGLSPAVNNINNFIKRRITQRELHLGLDALFFVGHPAVIGFSVIFIPLSVFIATILPGNNMIPGPDLVLIPFLMVWIISQSRGDIFRSFISSMIIVPLTLWISSDMGNLFSAFFQKYGIDIGQGLTKISSYSAGSNWIFWIFLQIIKPIMDLFS